MVPSASPHTKTPTSASSPPSAPSAPRHHHATSRASAGSQQEYSCILCKQRKVRCDRGNPCSGCLRAGVDCVPGVRQPYKRRKRIHHQNAAAAAAAASLPDSDNPHRPGTGVFVSTPLRPLDNRPPPEDPRPNHPQIPSFGQYVIISSLVLVDLLSWHLISHNSVLLLPWCLFVPPTICLALHTFPWSYINPTDAPKKKPMDRSQRRGMTKRPSPSSFIAMVTS